MDTIHSDEPDLDIHRSSGRLAAFFLLLLLATAIDLSAFWLLAQPSLSQAARIGVALMPLPANLGLLVMILRRIRRLDEFQKRVHFEAVVVGFLATGLAVFVYGYLQKAHAVAPLNMGLVWAFMLLFYAIGYVIATNHYK